MLSLAAEDVDLVVFPEAYLTGYCVDMLAAARKIAIPADHEAIETIRRCSEETGQVVIFGFAELDGQEVFNSAMVVDQGKILGIYRKTHLPELGLDKFVSAGDRFLVADTHVGKVGVLICFDLRHPEAARCLMLAGAELIVLPTNWPNGAQLTAAHFPIVRAGENRVFLAACNRVGTENGFPFIGHSSIVHPSGRLLAAAGPDEEIILAAVDLAEGKVKRNIIVPGKYETTVDISRRPELYGPIVKPLP